jgi:hypothetical protein
MSAKIIAQRFIERAEALNLKGKKRDDAALDYFVGAVAGAEMAGDTKLAEHLGVIAAMMISVRGYFAVREIAEKD